MKVFGGILVIFLLCSVAFAIPSEKKEGLEAEEVQEDETLAEIGEKTEKKELKKCQECDTSKCPKVTKCLSGLVRDRCGCCDVCGLEEGQLCNKDSESSAGDKIWYGRCGVELDCRLRDDIDISKVGNQSVCFCVKEGVFCGSDGVTYSSYCKLAAAIVQTDGKTVLESHGPCKSKPKIINKLPNREVKEKSDVSLRCETEAYPLPHFQWTFTRPNGVVKILPDDDTDISISTRGGPLKYQVTSHLLITNIQLKHEGTYGCIVSSEEGMDQMLARIVVSSQDDKTEM